MSLVFRMSNYDHQNPAAEPVDESDFMPAYTDSLISARIVGKAFALHHGLNNVIVYDADGCVEGGVCGIGTASEHFWEI